MGPPDVFSGMHLKEVLNSWSIDSEKVKGINDLRLRFVPQVEFETLSDVLIEFKTLDGYKYRVKNRSLISKGSNGKIFEAYRTSKSGHGYTPLVVKKTKCCLNSLRECALQEMVYSSIPNNCPRIYNVFRTKAHLWIFMQDLRNATTNVTCAKSLYYWLNSLPSFAGNKEKAIMIIVGWVFSLLSDLQQKYSFKHGDLHTQNIFIHSSSTIIKNVFLLDFGYGMLLDRTKHSKSPYWLEYKNGIDCAILLWSLWQNDNFKKYASADVLKWLSAKLVLDGFDLKTLNTSSELYQKLDGVALTDLKQFYTENITREFLNL